MMYRPFVAVHNHLLVALVLLGFHTSSVIAADDATKLKKAARAEFQNAAQEAAQRHLEELLACYRTEHSSDPSWRGRYRWSRRLAELAHEYLRAGKLTEAMRILGTAADLDVPLRKGLDNGLASAAGGLNRQLAALETDQRYEVLHAWSMPTESRRTVRVLESLVPVTAPPPIFARAFGERPRDSSFPISSVGEVSGVFSTAWELVHAADEAGRLRRLTGELERLTDQNIAKAKYVLTLAKVFGTTRKDDDLLRVLTERLTQLRDDLPRPTKSNVLQLDKAWRYGYGSFDMENVRTSDFTPFTHWSGAAWQAGANRPHSGLGFARVDRTGGHPAPKRSHVRRWVAPGDGVVLVTGTMYHPAAEGDGVRGRVVSSRTGLHGEWTVHDGPTKTETGEIRVTSGDTIDFLVDAIGHTYYDTFVWLVQLHLETDQGQQIYDSVADFCGPSEKHVVADVVMAAACLEHEWLRPIGESILQELIANTYDTDTWLNRPFEYRCQLIRPALRRAWATAVRKRSDETAADLLDDARLDFWIPATNQTSAEHVRGHSRDIWLGHEGHILHLAGSARDQLYFRYPLGGDFEFSFETQTGGRPGTDGGVNFGGLSYEVSVADELFMASAEHSRLALPYSQLTSRSRRFHGQYVGQPEFHRFAISSASDGVIFSSNGRPVWSDTSNDKTAPWLALLADGDRIPIFRNLKITGNPIIPREVRMSDSDQLRGWVTGFYDARREQHREDKGMVAFAQDYENQRISNANFRTPYFLHTDEIIASHMLTPNWASELVTRESNLHDWFAKDGVIHGRRRAGEDNTVEQRRLYYARPLQDGESIRYEFYYNAGEFEVHPALGRLAFLIDPDGVRLHWMTDGDREWTELAEDNAVVELFDRRGPKPLPLVDNDWNRMTVGIEDNHVTLALNDQTIYKRKLRLEDDRSFGLYRDATRSAARVRNVIMRGDWPKRLAQEQLDNLATVSARDRSVADLRALNHLFDEKHVADNVLAVRRRAANMQREQRYEYLAKWVLPSRDHASFRLYGSFGPTNPARPVAEYSTEEQARLTSATESGSTRVQTGGTIFAPALDLVDVADQLNRLDKLRDRVAASAEETLPASQTQARLAMLILIDIARGDLTAADRNLVEFCTQAVELPFVADERWPEMLVFSRALRHRELHQLCGESVFAIAEREIRGVGGTGSADYDRHLLALSGLKRHFDDGHTSLDSYFADAPLKQWSPVSKVSAKTRGSGMPVPRWRPSGKSVRNYAGHDHDFLYFQSPLRGDYEIDCEVTPFGWRESHLIIGGNYVAPVHGMSHYDLGNFHEHQGRVRIDPGLWSRSDVPFIHYRVSVKDGVASTFFNGREVHQKQLGKDHDPWVGIRSEFDRHGGVRDLRISGNPIIPSELRLVHDAELTGWVPYYDETLGNEWAFADGELVGSKLSEEGGEHRESLIYYHRPMLEDGSIEYDFYYAPGESHAHPALDRLAFLLEPDGVDIHWCTDGVDDRTSLPPSNRFTEPDNRRGPDRLPLKPGDWNHLGLSLDGNTVSLRLNGELVYRRDLEPSNMQQFGLFHYADRAETRVRNIVWEGDWPRELPSLADQELADVSLIAELDARLPDMEVFNHDFGKDQMPPEIFELPGSNPASVFAQRDDGFHLTVQGTNPNRWHDHQIQHRFSLLGDFDVTASFSQLKASFPQEHRYTGVALVACLESEPYINLWMHRRRSGAEENHQYVETTSQHPGPEGVRWDVWKNLPNESTSGTFRLARRGKTIYYLYADGDSTQFRLHRTQEVSDLPVRMNGLWLFTQVGGVGEASVVWKNISVHADQISPHPAKVAARRKAIVKRLARQLTGPLPKMALEFDGRTSHVRIPTLNYDGSYPITYEAFATPDALNNSIIIGDTQASGAGLAVNDAYNFHAWDGQTYQVAAADQAATRFMRVHLAATMQDGQLRLFVNGEEQPSSAQITDFVASSLPIVVGASPSPEKAVVDGQFKGVIDSVRITKGARYAENFDPPAEFAVDEDTVLCLRLDEGGGTRATDTTANKHHGIINDAKWVQDDAIRRRAAQGLAELGPPGVAVLIDALAHENPDIQIYAINALPRAGQNAKPAMPDLQRLAAHKNQRIRTAAEQASTAIRGDTVLKSLFNLFK